jgi:hypothetical protein
MKRHLFALAMLTALTGSGLFAQTVMKAGIPFDFAVGRAALPAGEYHITCDNNGVVTFRELAGKHNAVVLTRPSEGAAPSGIQQDAGKLLFQRYGNEYFLLSVWKPAAREGMAAPLGVRQKELAREAARPEMTIVALR